MPAPAPLVVPVAPVTLGLCQVTVGADKAANLATARTAVASAVAAGAQLVVLPECFNCPYSTDAFPEYAEPIPDANGQVIDSASDAPADAATTSAASAAGNASAAPSVAAIASWAREFGVFIVAGSIPERGT